MRGDTFQNIRAIGDKTALEDWNKQRQNKKLHQSFQPGCIHNLTTIPGMESFLFTTDLQLNICKTALKFLDHAFIDDISGFCSKYNGQKILGHHIYFRNPSRLALYFGGGIYTVDWTAHIAQKHFAYWLNLFNDFKKDSVVIGTWHCDWYVGYWNIICLCVNGMTVKEYQLYCWKLAFGLPLPDKKPLSLLCTCQVHGIKGLCRRYKSCPVTKKFVVDHWQILRLEKIIDAYMLTLSAFKAILVSKWINIAQRMFVVPLLTFDDVTRKTQYSEKHLDERLHLTTVVGDQVIADTMCFAGITTNEEFASDDIVSISLTSVDADQKLQFMDGYYMEYNAAKNYIFLSWTDRYYPCAANPLNNEEIQIQFERPGKKIWAYMWNTWLKWFGNYSAIIHTDVAKWGSDQLAEAGNLCFKVECYLIFVFVLFDIINIYISFNSISLFLNNTDLKFN